MCRAKAGESSASNGADGDPARVRDRFPVDEEDGLQVSGERSGACGLQQCAGAPLVRPAGDEMSHDRNGRVGPQRCHECNRPLTSDDGNVGEPDAMRVALCGECRELMVTEEDFSALGAKVRPGQQRLLPLG